MDIVEEPQFFTIKKHNAIFVWGWDSKIDTCAICRNSISDSCIECNESDNFHKCNICWGKCNHIFHVHCISRWLKIHNTCPLCSTDWDYERISE